MKVRTGTDIGPETLDGDGYRLNRAPRETGSHQRRAGLDVTCPPVIVEVDEARPQDPAATASRGAPRGPRLLPAAGHPAERRLLRVVRRQRDAGQSGGDLPRPARRPRVRPPAPRLGVAQQARE